ncbi:50S ribosomal protein L33 [Candidatus Dojkabacteria bacterium]|nr:50S ribosomal protein L33 [Candidatus Dojkabacteria bacterium]
MAKKENRVIVALKCEECGEKNYTTYKNKQLQEKLEAQKYCPKCKKHTQHKETKLK